MSGTVRTAILGASGFGGAELLRLCAGHPDLDVVAASGDAQAGALVADAYPSLAAAYPDLRYVPTAMGAAVDAGAELVFCALPHGASQTVVPHLRDHAKVIVDLAADFRLKDASLYPEWYGEAHSCPELIKEAVFGIPELFRDQLVGAGLVAAAGCYVTAASLALAPLVRAGVVEPTGVVVDAASGVSGAGKGPVSYTHLTLPTNREV